MKSLSELINENENNKTYKYVVDVKIEGTVTAGSEGDAGELVDKEIDKIDGVVDYKIASIDKTEDKVEEAVLLENDGDAAVQLAFDQIVDAYNNAYNNLPTPYYKAMLRTQLEMFFRG